MVNEIMKEMDGWYVKNNAGEISTTPTSKVLLPGIGVTKVKDLELVYRRWCEQKGKVPKTFAKAQPKQKVDVFKQLFD
jgi:hypothetical protein